MIDEIDIDAVHYKTGTVRRRPLRVYIASAYTIGDRTMNTHVQINKASELIDLGYIPFAPLLFHFVEMLYPKEYDKWCQIDNEWLLQCDVVLRIPGESKGADAEVALAIKNEIPVVHSIDELESLARTMIR